MTLRQCTLNYEKKKENLIEKQKTKTVKIILYGVSLGEINIDKNLKTRST